MFPCVDLINWPPLCMLETLTIVTPNAEFERQGENPLLELNPVSIKVSETKMSRTFRAQIFVAITLAFAGVVASCGGSSSDAKLTAIAANSGIKPNNDGFSFANFGSSATPESFNADDLVTMFGAGACVGENTTPCTPTAQAAKWAQMVNESRAAGHCEGLAVQAATRFQKKEMPETVKLPNQGEITHGIIRAFATQYLPEVQDSTNAWADKSLVDIVNELSTTFQAGLVSYTMGLYTPQGGHAVLPYALQFPSPELAVVKVYDSNWPGMERFVVIDLKAKTWYFSFSGTDPQKDDCAWSGKAGDIDITPMDSRTSATCPFCGDGTKVTKSVLLIRSTDLNWSVTTKNGTYTPKDATQVSDIRSKSLRAATCDKVVSIPEFILSTDETDFELNLPDTSSAYVSNGNSMVQITTEGSATRKPIVFKKNKVNIQDPTATMTVAVDNVVAQITTDGADVSIDNSLVSIDFGNSAPPVVASDAKPQIVVTAVNDAPPVVTEVKDLNSVEAPVIAALTPPEVKGGLSAAGDRDLANPTYSAFVENTPVTPVTAPPMTTTTTLKSSTTLKAATTTMKATNSTSGNQEASSASSTPASTSGSTASTAAPSGTTGSTATTQAPSSASTTTTTTDPRRTIKLVLQSGEPADSWGWIYGSQCLGNGSPKCHNFIQYASDGDDITVDWGNFDSDYLFEIKCPGSSVYIDPQYQSGVNSGSRHVGHCEWTVNGNATVYTRSK